MASGRRKLILALALTLEDDTIWREEIQKAKAKRSHTCWERGWIGRGKNKVPNTIFDLQKELEREDPLEFMSMLRMDVETFHWLCEQVGPYIVREDTNFRDSVSVEQRMSITLSYLAVGGSNATLSRQYRRGRSTVGKVIYDTCLGIAKALRKTLLATSRDARFWWKCAKEFELRWQFPHCIGAIDGKHVDIRQPNNSGSIYFNYHHRYSIVLMAIVSANYEFSYIDVGAEGRVNDGGIWRACQFRAEMDSGKLKLPPPEPIHGVDGDMPFVIVGDDAFPLGPGLMKPYAKRGLEYKERVFNYRLSRARRLSENAFGILSNRFRIFLTTIDRPPDVVEAMVIAACILHNLMRRRCPRAYMPPGAVDSEDSSFNIVQGTWRVGQPLHKLGPTAYRNPTRYAKAVQEKFADYFVGPGAVPWQDEQIYGMDT